MPPFNSYCPIRWTLRCFLLVFLGFSSFSTALLEAGISPTPTPTSKYLKKTTLSETSSGLEGVDCIYVINLDSRPEKWQRVNELLRANGLKANRFSGVKGWELTIEARSELCGPYPIRLSAGEFGCLLSHLSVIKDAYERGFNCIWVCEDDIDILRKVSRLPKLLRRLARIDKNWDVFYTDIDTKNAEGVRVPSVDADFRPDFHYKAPRYYLERSLVDSEIMSIRQRFGMYSFFLSRQGMKKILHYFTHVYLWSAVDIDLHYVPHLRQYSTTKDYVSIWYKSPFSDIVRAYRESLPHKSSANDQP